MSNDEHIAGHQAPIDGTVNDTGEPSGLKRRGRSRWSYVFGIVTVLVVGALLGTVLVLRFFGDEARVLTKGATRALSGAFTRNVTHEFITTAPQLHSETNLEIASITMHEVCTRTEREKTPLWPDSERNISLTVPVTYRYFVPWDDEWNIIIDHHPASGDHRTPAAIVVNVIAPKIHAALPPAPDTSELTIRRYNNWVGNLSHRDLLESVVKEWTPEFSRKAESDEYVSLIRELGRRQIGLFVRSWVQLREDIDPGAKILVEVRFRDELGEARSQPRVRGGAVASSESVNLQSRGSRQ